MMHASFQISPIFRGGFAAIFQFLLEFDVLYTVFILERITLTFCKINVKIRV